MSHCGTPLRYPGGKQRLTPFVIDLLSANDLVGGDYVEPYAGGAGVGIELILRGIVRRIHLNDSSFPVFAFWKAVLEEPERFCRGIASASLTVDEWRRHREIMRSGGTHSTFDVGFSTFVLNRCNRSGVLTGGVIGGLDQSGPWKIDARFPKNELIRRIESIALLRSKIKLSNLDAEDFLLRKVRKLPEKTLVYCDPPYYNKSSRLYLDYYNAVDHQRLATVIQTKLNHHWLVSYDEAPEIISLYSERKCFLYELQYSASRAYKGKEILILADKTVWPDSTAALPAPVIEFPTC